MHIATWTWHGATMALVAFAASCADSGTKTSETDEVSSELSSCPMVQAKNAFSVERLVSDNPDLVPAEFTDPLLKNAWGLAAGPESFWWVVNNGTKTATLYDGEGNKQSLEVTIPGAPTGEVFSGGDGFIVRNGNFSGPARFIFASEDGTLLAWSPAVPPPAPARQAFVVVHDGSKDGAIYKGLAIAETSSCGEARLYATDFHNAKVDVFDTEFQPVSLSGDAFVDDRLPAGYAPFGIREIEGTIFVTYAKQDADAEDEIAGLRRGFVDAFDLDGNLLFRAVSRGRLNAPWGLAMAPDDFGRFGGMLLVGNFGDGRIHAYDLSRCNLRGCLDVGALRDEDGRAIAIDGLWALDFGKGNEMTGDTDALYFTAGPNEENNGLFGYIEPVSSEEE